MIIEYCLFPLLVKCVPIVILNEHLVILHRLCGMVWYGYVLFDIIEYAMPEIDFDKKKVQRCPETTHRILLGFSLACSD